MGSSLLILAMLYFGALGNHTAPQYPYLTYLPKDYTTSGKKYPLVIYLHGSSGRGTNLASVKVSGLPRMAEEGQRFDFILIAPQCPAGKIWSSEDWAGPLLKELKTKYRVDNSKIYLTGVSMGGGGTFDVAKKYPDVFAALAPLCAWASDTYQICKLKNIPVWTFHGTEDHVVPISQTEQKVKALKECGGNIKYTRLKGEGHGIHGVYNPQNEYKLLEWMLSHSKN
jgi:predicted peptidase